MKFSGKVGNGIVNKWLHFGGDPDHRLDTGIVFRICHYWEILKVVNGHSFILIRQMAALVRRALAEICTVRPSDKCWHMAGLILDTIFSPFRCRMIFLQSKMFHYCEHKQFKH